MDYKNYILAFCAAQAGDIPKAKDLLRAIKGKAYRQYAATDPKLKALYKDEESVEMTK